MEYKTTEYIATEDFIYDGDLIIKKNEKLEIFHLDKHISAIKIPNKKIQILNIQNNNSNNEINSFFDDKIEKGIIITLAEYRNNRINEILE